MICFLVKLNLRLVCPYLSGFGPVIQKSKVNNGFCQKSADSECRRLAVKFDSQEEHQLKPLEQPCSLSTRTTCRVSPVSQNDLQEDGLTIHV